MRENVTFRTSIPYDRSLHPVGEEVARALLGAVDATVRRPGRLEDWRDSGFELQYVLSGKRVHIAMAHIENQPFEFYAQVASYVGWLRRLLGYRDVDQIEQLVKALHHALTSSSAFTHIAWHTAGTTRARWRRSHDDVPEALPNPPLQRTWSSLTLGTRPLNASVVRWLNHASEIGDQTYGIR